MTIISIDSFDYARQTVVIGEIISLCLRVAVLAYNKDHIADILGVLQVFFATLQKSLVVATKDTWYWRHSTLFHMSDVAIEWVVFFTAVSVTLEDHLFEVGFIQKVDTFLVKVKFLAGRTIHRMLPIYLNA